MSNILVRGINAVITLLAKDALGNPMTSFSADKALFTVTDDGGATYPISSLTWNAGVGTMVVMPPDVIGGKTLTIRMNNTPVPTHPPAFQVSLVDPYQGRFNSQGAVILTDGAGISGQTSMKDFKTGAAFQPVGGGTLSTVWNVGDNYDVSTSLSEFPSAARFGLSGVISGNTNPLYQGIGLPWASYQSMFQPVGGDYPVRTLMMVMAFRSSQEASLWSNKHPLLPFVMYFSKADDPSRNAFAVGTKLYSTSNHGFPYLVTGIQQAAPSTVYTSFSASAQGGPLDRTPRPAVFLAIRINGSTSASLFDIFWNGIKREGTASTNVEASLATGATREGVTGSAFALTLAAPFTLCAINPTYATSNSAILDFAAYPDAKSDQFILDQAAAWGLSGL